MKTFLLALAISASVPALAAPDQRIVTLHYDDASIIRFEARASLQSTIAFEEGERIENIALGDSAHWQVTPNKRANLLFIKPMAAVARTNMTVVTDRRTYLFDLVATPKAPAIYMLRFTYPAPPPPVTAQAAEPAAPAEPEPAKPLALNFGWTAKGAKSLVPERIFDDGRSLYLSWPQAAPLPAILAPAPDGTEGPLNYAVRGEYIIVEGVPARIVLRSAKAVATLLPAAARATATKSLPQTAER